MEQFVVGFGGGAAAKASLMTAAGRLMEDRIFSFIKPVLVSRNPGGCDGRVVWVGVFVGRLYRCCDLHELWVGARTRPCV